jgi:hypothetical protein
VRSLLVKRILQILGFVAIAIGGAVVVLLAGAAGALALESAGGSLPGFVLGVVVALAILSPLVRRRFGPRAPVAFSIALLGLVPVVALFGLMRGGRELVHGDHLRCGWDGLLFLFLPALFVSASPFLLLIARSASGDRPRVRVDRLLTLLAGVAIASALALAARDAVQAFGRPTADRWIASLPIVARFDPARSRELAVDGVGTLRVGTVETGKRAFDEISIAFAGQEPSTIGRDRLGGEIVLRADAARRLLIVEGISGVPLAAFRDGHRTAVRAADLAGTIARPRSLAVAAAVGGIVAATILARGFRRARRFGRYRWRRASKDGLALRLEEGILLRAEEEVERLPDGAVLTVGLCGGVAGVSYRHLAASEVVVERRSLEETLAMGRAILPVASAHALAVATFACALLVGRV